MGRSKVRVLKRKKIQRNHIINKVIRRIVIEEKRKITIKKN